MGGDEEEGVVESGDCCPPDVASSCAKVWRDMCSQVDAAAENFKERQLDVEFEFATMYMNNTAGLGCTSPDIPLPGTTLETMVLRTLELVQTFEGIYDRFLKVRVTQRHCFSHAQTALLPWLDAGDAARAVRFEVLAVGTIDAHRAETGCNIAFHLQRLTKVKDALNSAVDALRSDVREVGVCHCDRPGHEPNAFPLWRMALYQRVAAGLEGGSGFDYDGPLLLFLVTELLPRGATVADVGAGTGEYALWLNRTKRVTAHAFDGAGAEAVTKGLVQTLDLSQPLPASWTRAFDWVLCLDVAEHVPPASAADFLANLRRLARVGLVLSWTDMRMPDHANPRPWAEAQETVEKAGFKLDAEVTADARLRSEFYGHREGTEATHVDTIGIFRVAIS